VKSRHAEPRQIWISNSAFSRFRYSWLAPLSAFLFIALISVLTFYGQSRVADEERLKSQEKRKEQASIIFQEHVDEMIEVSERTANSYSPNKDVFEQNLSSYINDDKFARSFPDVIFASYIPFDEKSSIKFGKIYTPMSSDSKYELSELEGIEHSSLIDIEKEYSLAKESGETQFSDIYQSNNLTSRGNTFIAFISPVYDVDPQLLRQNEKESHFVGNTILTISIQEFLAHTQSNSSDFKYLALHGASNSLISSTRDGDSFKNQNIAKTEVFFGNKLYSLSYDDIENSNAQVTHMRRSTLISGLGLSVIVFFIFAMVKISENRARTYAQKAERQVVKAKALYENALENAPIGVALVHKDGECFFTNEALETYLGLTNDEMKSVRLRDFIADEDKFAFSDMWQNLDKQSSERSSTELRFNHPDGRLRWGNISTQAVYDDDTFQYYVVQIEDTTERRSIAERLEYQAIHDPLTGLPNRLLFVDRLEVALQRSKRSGLGVTVLFMDLDRFKVVNDSLGHAAGDSLLVAVADRIKASVRPNDTIARFGGDEFVILCEDITDEKQTEEISQRLLENINRPIPLEEGEVYVTASIGVAKSLAGEDTPETILRDADTAMYRAKDGGRNRMEVFDERTHARAVANLETGNAMFRALDQNEFRVRYQPVISLASGRLSGFEALAYWQDPNRGQISAGEFIPLAEETGVIVPLGIKIFEEACTVLHAWHQTSKEASHLTMSINLSPRQLAEPSLVNEVSKVLKKTGVNPNRVWFEITETALMVDADSTIAMLEQLRNLGVHFEVDDFGTGFSSLSYLKKFPVDALKIDQGFVDGLGRDPEDTAIVTAVISLAHALGLHVVAEGVETPLQMAELKTLGCEYAQGFLFSKAKDAPEWKHQVKSNELFKFATESI